MKTLMIPIKDKELKTRLEEVLKQHNPLLRKKQVVSKKEILRKELLDGRTYLS